MINEIKMPDNLFIVREWGVNLGSNVELLKCLNEFYGEGNVTQIVVPNNANFLNFVLPLLDKAWGVNIWLDTRVFIVDARVKSLLVHLSDVGKLNFYLKAKRITPICIMTDSISAPGYQLVGELLVRGIGVLIPLGEDTPIRGLSKISRVGGVTNPISKDTALRLVNSRSEPTRGVFLGGLLYEPRKSYILKVHQGLILNDVDAEIVGKSSNSYMDYLVTLSNFRIVINTNFVVNSKKLHMVSRNIETLHAGSLLLTQNTSRIVSLFEEGKHYIAITSPEDAIKKAIYYYRNPDLASEVAKCGQKRAIRYAEESDFIAKVELAKGKIGGLNVKKPHSKI